MPLEPSPPPEAKLLPGAFLHRLHRNLPFTVCLGGWMSSFVFVCNIEDDTWDPRKHTNTHKASIKDATVCCILRARLNSAPCPYH